MVRKLDEQLASSIERFTESVQVCVKSITNAVNEKSWDNVKSVSDNPLERLEEAINNLDEQAASLEGESQSAALEELEVEFSELTDKKTFLNAKDVFIKYVEHLKLMHQISDCIDETSTTGISKKASHLNDRLVTKAFQRSLHDELDVLGMTYLPINVKKSGERGTPRHQLELVGARSRPDLCNVLSEGEQRVVAIASFLAELKTMSKGCSIVFDDPVCSLDHLFREKIAQRFVEEAKARQVIIFTHDIWFLLAIKRCAAEKQVPLLSQSVSKDLRGAGICATGLPLKGMSVNDRLGRLRQLLQAAEKNQKEGNREEYGKMAIACYSQLRSAWERAVEELLLNLTVERFRPSVETQRLLEAYLSDQLIVDVQYAMSKCSRWIEAHDKAPSDDTPIPDSVVLAKDIRSLEQFVKDVRKCAKAARAERRKLLEPPSGT
jgi:energy-coupling factor transporter ATP-binding protein EcfA2